MMRILVVCSGNAEQFDFKIHQAFVYEQIETICSAFDSSYETYFVKGKGMTGYVRNLQKLQKKIEEYSPDIVHAHFGLSGILACLQRMRPVIVTFHGSDGYIPFVRYLSKAGARLSAYNIFVSEKVKKKINGHNDGTIIPCGVDTNEFYPVEKSEAKKLLGMHQSEKLILFSSHFNNPVKNYSLAKVAIEKTCEKIALIELKNKSREEVNLLLNAAELLLLTSFSEGSPQIIKEAMACNCPIVATDVGDIRDVISGTDGCYLTTFDSDDVAEKIRLALGFSGRTNGRDKIRHLDNKIIAEKVYQVYKKVLNR